VSDPLRLITSAPPCENIADVMDELLEMMQAGGVSSLAIAMVDRDGCANTIYSHAPSLSTLIGAVSVLQHRLCQALIDA